MKVKNKIFVAGLWHLGLVNAICLADLGWDVIAYDEDCEKVQKLNDGELPLFEPGLKELLKQNLKLKRLQFTNDVSLVKECRIVFVTYDTPLNDYDEVDLSIISRFINKVTKFLLKNSIVVFSSQMPVGSSGKYEKIIKRVNSTVEVAYVPENLRLGHAVERFMHPSMIVIGSNKKDTAENISKIYSKIKTKIFLTDIRSSEMVKHAINTFLATSISFANELSGISEKVGADFFEVARIIKADERIGLHARVAPGLGFAGGTLARDLKILKSIGVDKKIRTPLVDSILEVNDFQKKWVINKIKEYFKNKVANKKIVIFGLTYTPNTSTLRRSLSVETIRDLIKMGANIFAYDPQADLTELDIQIKKKIVISKDWKTLTKGAYAVVIMTTWNDFLKFPWNIIVKNMKNKLIIDPNNFLLEIKLPKNVNRLYAGKGKI